MKNPLIKRMPREFKGEFGKYAVIFLFMIIMIGFVSGFMVASGSMKTAYDNSFEKYNIEDGNFELYGKADTETIKKLEEADVKIYENFYIERETENIESTLRIFKIREDVNKICVMEGELPDGVNEVAIDRMYADNNSLSVNDKLIIDGEEYAITGLVAFSDYSALYQNPSDMMFEAIQFGVGVMTEKQFDELGENGLHFSYSWKYNNPPADDTEAKEMSEDFVDVIAENAVVTQYIPMYTNQAIQFTGDDMGRDRTTFTAFLYIVVAIIAFIMAITTSNTIAKEAAVIGTLRASGYTKGEIIRHYLAIPMTVIIISALIGNILGYTVFIDVAVGMYYANYSLPTFEVIWNADAFIRTTVVPVILMFVINFAILASKMSLSPLKFLRRDLKKGQKKKAFRLNTKIGIMHRFRLRIIFQNMPNYITIFVGVLLANVILLLGAGFPELLSNNQRLVTENMIAEYQYILKAPAETETDTAEKYCTSSLMTPEGKLASEPVTIYAVAEDSSYVNIDTHDGVYISDAYSNKYDVKTGDIITLKEEFSSKKYSFRVDGIYDYPTIIAVFMDMDFFNETFGNDEGYYNGYLSKEEISDIDDMFIAAKITENDLTKLARQMTHSMGPIMNLFLYFGIVMFMLIIYLLSKIVLEKNAQSISMTKILGYSNAEISGLYIVSTSIVVILSFILSMPLVDMIMRFVCERMFSSYSGYLPYDIPAIVYVKNIAVGIIAYAVIAFAQFHKLRKIPMDMALKNAE
ncbi:MAG: ABC transporter permease [Oscillospiraceae bacterium]|nr:ABC transporter permease [Oscillospiraceae bacterium]